MGVLSVTHKLKFTNNYIIIIIIIMSRRQRGYPWPSLATPPYRPLLAIGLQGYIPYRDRAAVCRPAFARLCERVHKSTSLISSSLLLQQCPAGLVRLILIVFVMGGRCRTSAAFWGSASRTCSILLAVFLCNCRQAFLHTFVSM